MTKHLTSNWSFYDCFFFFYLGGLQIMLFDLNQRVVLFIGLINEGLM